MEVSTVRTVDSSHTRATLLNNMRRAALMATYTRRGMADASPPSRMQPRVLQGVSRQSALALWEVGILIEMVW